MRSSARACSSRMSPEPVSTSAGPPNVSSRTSPEPLLILPDPSVPSTVMSALPVLTATSLSVGTVTATSRRESPPRKPVRCGRDDADLVAGLLDPDLVGVAPGHLHVGLGGVGGNDADGALADLDVQVHGLGGLEVVLGHVLLLGVFVRGASRCAGPSGGVGGGSAGQIQPVMRRWPRLPPLKGSWSPKNGMLDRSMSTLIALSRVAARTTLTSQVLSEWPERAASSSALALTDSGSRSVIRATLPSSSTSSAVGGVGGAGGAGALGRALDHEVELAAVEPDVDAAGRHLGGDLGGRLGDGLHQGQPGGGVEREGEALGGLAGLGAGGLGGGDEVPAEAVDVRRDVHAHHRDIT